MLGFKALKLFFLTLFFSLQFVCGVLTAIVALGCCSVARELGEGGWSYKRSGESLKKAREHGNSWLYKKRSSELSFVKWNEWSESHQPTAA